MDRTGFDTMFVSRVENTSESPPGDVPSAGSACSLMLTGKRELPITATRAASRVVVRYRLMTVRKRGPSPPRALAIDAATRTATRIGAMALRALTNTWPRMPMNVQCGQASPRTAPMTRPMKIRSTRLLSDHFFRRTEKVPMQ